MFVWWSAMEVPFMLNFTTDWDPPFRPFYAAYQQEASAALDQVFIHVPHPRYCTGVSTRRCS